jgi:hypothetical protein
MPNFDGGHYFLSALIPICEGSIYSRIPEEYVTSPDRGKYVTSHVHCLREVLASIPSENPRFIANHNANTISDQHNAPFSRDLNTHFSRFAIVDDVAYVGKQHKDAILATIQGKNPVIPETIDQLPFSYLAWIAEFDTEDGSDSSLKKYLHGLWDVMEFELTAIFRHCQNFNANNPKESFVNIVFSSRLETTMSFNDYYWSGEPGLWKGSPSLPNKLPGVISLPLVSAGIIFVVSLIKGVSGWTALLLFFILSIVTILWIYRRILIAGATPFPAAPRTDLRSILKSLYLQRQFIRFMIKNQAVSPKTLKTAFAEFIALHNPEDISFPTQAPGSITS